MSRLGALLDARFVAVGVEGQRMAPLRLVILAALVVIGGMGVGWTPVLIWGAVVLANEMIGRPTAKRMVDGTFTRTDLWIYFWHSMWGVPAWTTFGLLLWLGPSEACRF